MITTQVEAPVLLRFKSLGERRIARKFALMQCGIANVRPYVARIWDGLTMVFFSTSNTAAVSWSPSPIAIASV